MRTYLDWNATTPPWPEVVDAMHAAATAAWGNPASVHTEGRHARARVEEARLAVARLGDVDGRDVVLTSGGTEANNVALRSAFASDVSPRVLALSRLEHPSVTRVAEALAAEGRADVRWIQVLGDGSVDLDDLRRAFAEGAVGLVALQAVNHETGVIQPVDDAALLAAQHNTLLHVDMVQAWGKVDVGSSAGHTRSLAAHKIRGPKGIGALLTRPGVSVSPVLRGGAQERGVRPGTVDPVACAGLALAADRAVDGPRRYESLAVLRDELEAALLEMVSGATVNGTGLRAPHVTNISWPGWVGGELVAALDLEGLAVSSGSACSAGTTEPSPVLRAMVGDTRAGSAVRFSLGEGTTRDDISRATQVVRRVVTR